MVERKTQSLVCLHLKIWESWNERFETFFASNTWTSSHTMKGKYMVYENPIACEKQFIHKWDFKLNKT